MTGAVPLICHPRTPLESVHTIEVVAALDSGGRLILTYVLRGVLSSILVPTARSSRRAEKLWRHTCFEAFVMAGAGPAYREFNFSPSGEWASYDFHGYREGGAPMDGPAPEINVRRNGNRLSLDAEIRPECLPPDRLLHLGLSAVVEGVGGELSYWALRHIGERPDFHHPDVFMQSLVSPMSSNIEMRGIGKAT